MKNYPSTFNFFSGSFSLLCAFQKKMENRIKLKKIINLNCRPKWNTSSQIYKLHLIFLSTLALKDHYKWRAYKSEYGDGNNARPKVCSKSNKWWKKYSNPSWNHWSSWRTNCVSDHPSVQRIKIVDSTDFTEVMFLIYLLI